MKNATVAGLARAIFADIDRAGDAVKHAKRGRIHTFVSTSPIHLAHQMRKTEAEVLEIITATVTRARNLVEDVEWSAMDATRTGIDYLCQCVEAAIKAGATTINLPDTVGYATPEEYAGMFRAVRERVPNADRVIFSTHCHNDLGLAVANSLAALGAGARQIECTINGIGERAGNAALEEVVMAIRTRRDNLPYDTGIDSTMLSRASRLVSAVTNFPVQYNKAIVGRNAFAHESGIHQDGILKYQQTYEIMTPESVGVGKSSLVMGKHSGRNAFRSKLKELGYELGENAFEDAFVRFKGLADRKKHVYDEDIEALVDEGIAHMHDRMKVVLADRHRRQHGAAVGDADARHRRRAAHRAGDRQRPGGRHLQRHQDAGAARRQARPLPGARRHRGHRRAGRGVGAAGGGRAHGHGPRRRHRHHGRLGARLRLGAQQAAGEAAEDRSRAAAGALAASEPRASLQLCLRRRSHVRALACAEESA